MGVSIKSILIIAVLLLAAACDTTVSSKKITKECKHNGEKVDCSYFNKVEVPKTMQLSASITVAAEISETQIEILENAEKFSEKDGNECGLEVHAGMIISIKKVGKLLMVSVGGDSATYLPTSNANEWQNIAFEKGSTLMITTKIRLEEKSFSSDISCLFI